MCIFWWMLTFESWREVFILIPQTGSLWNSQTSNAPILLKIDCALVLFIHDTPTCPIKVQRHKVRTGTHWATGWKQPEINSYLLYLWQDELPSGHKDVFLQRGHIAGWVVNSLFSGVVCGAFPSRWNGPSSKSLFYSPESCRTLGKGFILCLYQTAESSIISRI